MTDLKVITNNHLRDILYWYELTDEERAEFDWLETEDEQDSAEFIRYKDNTYCLDEFMRLDHVPGEPDEFKSWDGYHGDSFFSGILVKYPYIDNCPEYGIDTDHIIAGWYLS